MALVSWQNEINRSTGPHSRIVIRSARLWREESAFLDNHKKQIPRYARDDKSCVFLCSQPLTGRSIHRIIFAKTGRYASKPACTPPRRPQAPLAPPPAPDISHDWLTVMKTRGLSPVAEGCGVVC